MTGSSRNRTALLVIGVAAACAGVALTVGLAYPTPVSNPTLGAEWQCHRAAAIVTTCRYLSRAQPSTYRIRSLANDATRV